MPGFRIRLIDETQIGAPALHIFATDTKKRLRNAELYTMREDFLFWGMVLNKRDNY